LVKLEILGQELHRRINRIKNDLDIIFQGELLTTRLSYLEIAWEIRVVIDSIDRDVVFFVLEVGFIGAVF
jgi:hypothetical protein